MTLTCNNALEVFKFRLGFEPVTFFAIAQQSKWKARDHSVITTNPKKGFANNQCLHYMVQDLMKLTNKGHLNQGLWLYASSDKIMTPSIFASFPYTM